MEIAIRVIGLVGIPLIIFFSSFYFFRGLKDDLEEEVLLKLILRGVFGGLIGTSMTSLVGSFFNFPSTPRRFWWWGLLVGALVFTLPSVKKSPKFWKIFDRLIFTLAITIFFINLDRWLSLNLSSFSPFVIFSWVFALTGLLALIVLSHTYRRLAWYKSGKPGFIGFLSLIYLGLSRLALVINYSLSVYWPRLVELPLVCVVVSIGVIGFYSRSGRSLQEDRQTLVRRTQIVNTLKVKYKQLVRRKLK